MGEKKVEHIELFYDLIFVFCISKLTAFLEPMTERFDDFSPLPYYLLMFMILLQIWILTTFLMNRYGYRHATDYACIFINMFFLFFMADGIREDWTNDTFLRFHVAWAPIMLNLALQFGYKLHRHECMDKLDEKIIKRYMAILLTEGTLAALCIPVFLSTGKLLAIIPLAVGIGLVAWSAPLFGKRPVHFDHLAERISLLVVITFGEMVVGITGSFTTSSKPFFGMMVLRHRLHPAQHPADLRRQQHHDGARGNAHLRGRHPAEDGISCHQHADLHGGLLGPGRLPQAGVPA